MGYKMETSIVLSEEGALYRLYRATNIQDAERFSSIVGAQSIRTSPDGIEILVLIRGRY